jgi:DNA-directed RNA polymerase subunit omega
MQSQLLEEASKVITTPQVLVNVISRRVRQLVQGHRSLAEVQPRMGFADIALTEVIEGKLSFEMIITDAAEASSPRIIELAAFPARKKAA